MNLRHPSRLRPLAAAVAALFAAPLLAAPAPDALPSGGQVVAGQASIAQSGAAMTITQGSDRAILHWQGFDIGSQASVQFVQPSSSAVALNRVLAGEASQIYGTLSANGIVYLVNPNGVVFGAGSRVDVGGLVASALDIADDDFLAGRDVFQRNGATGKVENRGQITAANGGLVALLAPEVRNEGVIAARLGNVVLAAGERITLEAGAGGHLHVAVDPATVSALVDNRHLIQADGGQVVMSAQAADTLLSAVVANSGTVQARTLENRAGRILLLADMAQGEVRQDGLLDASAPVSGDGGFIETSAAKVGRGETARVTTLAANGQTGLWLIDPNDYTIAASGGNITGTQLSTDLGTTHVQISTATQGTAGGNGDIFVNDAVSWSANKLTLTAERNIQINANLNGSGTAQLALEYGQGAVAAGNTADYYVNGVKVNLPAGDNFSTKLGNDGATATYTVLTSLGVEHSGTGTDLQGINGALTKNYALGADIPASATSVWTGGFNPIAWQFSGNFSGLGHVITDLSINRPGVNGVGLFSYAGESGTVTIRDIGLVGGSITGDVHVGGLAGQLKGSSTIRNSYSTSAVTGAYNVGGLVGSTLTGTVIEYSFASGNINASGSPSNAGGLVGVGPGTIRYSYATGNVSGAGDFVGGLIGDGSNAPISYSYATGSVSGGLKGGLNGRDAWVNVTASYWDTVTTGQEVGYGGTGKTTVEMKQQATFVGWDFGNVWRIYEDASYPVLRALQQAPTVIANNASKTYDGAAYSGGNGYSSGTAPLTGSPTYGGSAQGAANAGSYAIGISGLSLNRTGQLHYQQWSEDIRYVDGVLTIDPRAITVAASNQSRAYGSSNPTAGATTVTTGSLAGTDALGTATLTAAGSATVTANAGTTHALTPSAQSFSTGSASNYSITYVDGTLTITAAPLTVTANNASKTYDGLAWSGGNGVAYSGFVNSETAAVLGGTLGWGGTSQGATNAGSYVLTPSGLTSGNYTITFVDGVLTIAAAAASTSVVAAAQQPQGGGILRQQIIEIAPASPMSPGRSPAGVPAPPPLLGDGPALNGLLVFAPDFISGGEE